MKKIIFVLLLGFLFSCEKEEYVITNTTYQIENNFTEWRYSDFEYWCNDSKNVWILQESYEDQLTITYQDTIYDIWVKCYDDADSLIRTDTIYNIPKFSKSEKIEITPNITKIRYSYYFLPSYHKFYTVSINYRRELGVEPITFKLKYYHLIPNENNIISIGNVKPEDEIH